MSRVLTGRPALATLWAIATSGPASAWISPPETIELNCYAMRYPDLLTGYCNGNTEVHKTADQKHEIKSCNYGGLLSHWNNVGSKEGRTRACVDANVKCYAMANPDLLSWICPAGYAHCDWHSPENHFLQHYAAAGYKEGRMLACDSPAARCYLQRNPQVVNEVCAGDAAKCDFMAVHTYYLNNPAADASHEFACDRPVETAATEDTAKAEAFGLRGVMFSWSCKLSEFAGELQCKARSLSAAIKKEADPEKKLKLQAQQDTGKTVTPEQKKLEVAAGKRMYVAYCARSPPPDPRVCQNELLKRQLGQ